MSGETVLIVEDDAIVRSLLQKALKRSANYQVIVAEDGQRGLDLILEDPPDAVLLDLALPLLNGMDVLQELHRRKIRVPTIIITADGRSEQILKAFRFGAKDFLQKPFGMEDMRSALENALTEERLRRERDQLTKALTDANRRQHRQLENWAALNFIAKTIISTLEEPEVLRRVVATANHLLDVEAGSLLLLDPETQKLHFAITLQGDEAQISNMTLNLGQGIAGWVAQSGEALLVPDVRKDPRFYSEVDRITGFESHAILCVPLKARNRILGVFEVINKRSGPESPSFTDEDQRILSTLASWIAIAVENARFYREMQDTAAARTLRQMVVTLAHHINNQLMNCSLELDSLEQRSMPEAERADAAIEAARGCVEQITRFVRALDQVTEIRTVSYVGTEEMLDIDDVLFQTRLPVDTESSSD
jgi:DNA-binding response OmpR family regulator/putative methionine-R-sulfoxide reductase with GAF domain